MSTEPAWQRWAKAHAGILAAAGVAVLVTQVADAGARWWVQGLTTVLIALWQRYAPRP